MGSADMRACGIITGNVIRLDGSLLGDSDGMDDGTLVGSMLKLGTNDGVVDGTDVGNKVESIDGTFDGPFEGPRDGNIDC